MKARIGDLVLEDLTPQEAIELARQWTQPPKDTPKAKRVKPQPAGEKPVRKKKLSPAQVLAWQWLKAHDTLDGSTPKQYAEDAAIKASTANARFLSLVRDGMAHQLRKGHYRVGEAPTLFNPVDEFVTALNGASHAEV